MEYDDYIQSGKIASRARQEGYKMIEEGLELRKLADYLEDLIRGEGAQIGFPVNLSINNEAAHFTPAPDTDMKFQQGDLVKLDLGAEINGCLADTAVTKEVTTDKWTNLIKATDEALENAIKKVRVGAITSEIGREIENTIKKYGFNPVYNLTGHTLEKYVLHAGTSFPNYDDGSRVRLYPGMTFAIEPFATTGKGKVKGLEFGNIMICLKEDSEESLKTLRKVSRGLPFSMRDAARSIENYDYVIREAQKKKYIYFYPVLKENKGEMVAQTEHSIYLREDGPVVTTL
ncbi:MAG: type II methionyl aminopeptidase [Candidatus Thermoplasmatota archaeon]|jgi:methionyl aminopeptidase|nr:type II methionyl aminopeptidase [Candidatus Thermoplasmatota archaeon]MCL5930693.1 type II methionyl aminopeptidase [Candidatus Thermoplasmatota archaeon]